MKQFHNRLLAEWRVLALCLGLLAGLAGAGGWLSRLDLVLYDLALMSWLRPAPDDIVIVAADEASLAAIGRWPWRRAVHGTLLDRLTAGGARVVGLDILLDEADQADGASDGALAKAMEQNGRVVLPVTQGPGEGGGAEAIRPMPAFASRAAALGFADVRLDADGIARSVWLAEGAGRAGTPHFAYAVLQVAEPKNFPLLAQESAGTAAGQWQRAWPMFIPFAGPPGHFRTVSYVDVLLGKVPAETFRGKLVLVGVTAAGIGDNNPVPTSGNGRVMAGVEISANVIDALRRDVAIRALPAPLAGGVCVLVILGLLALLRRTSPRNGLLLSLGAGVALVTFCALLLRFGQAWFPPAAALAACALAYPLWSWRRLEAAQRYLDGELAQLAVDGGILPGTAPAKLISGSDALEHRIELVRAAAEGQRDARRFLADALESLPAGMLVADRTGKIVLANRRAALLLGLRPGRDPLGVPLSELLARLKPVGGGDARLGGGGNSWKALKMEVSSGAASNLLLDVAPCRGDGGRYLGLVASLTDVVELRVAQQARDESMRFLSHDLRSPLTTIVTLLDAAADDPPDNEAEKTLLLDRIGSYARRSLALADDMLRLGRAEAADPSAFVELDLRAVLEEAVDEVWPVAQARQIRLLPSLSGDTDAEALVRGDGEMLRRAFVNLLGNAVKYSGNGTAITLGLARDGAGWRVTVADQGRGIPTDKLPQLFTRYGRFPASQDYVEGIGLGLVIVKAVIDAHGGAIEVHSEPGHGTTFLVSLPGVSG